MFQHVGCEKISVVEFTPNGKKFITVAREEVKVWDVESGRYLQTLQTNELKDGHHGLILIKNVQITADNNQVAVLDDRGRVGIFDIDTGLCVRRLSNEGTESIAIAGNLIIGINNGKILIWDIAINEPLTKLSRKLDLKVNSFAVTPDGSKLILLPNAESIRQQQIVIMDLETGRPLEAISVPWLRREGDIFSSFVTCSFIVTISPDSKILALSIFNGDHDGYIYFWSLHNSLNYYLGSIELAGIGLIIQIKICSDNNTLLVLRDNGMFQIFSIKMLKKLTEEIQQHRSASGNVNPTCFAEHPKDRSLLAGYANGKLKFFAHVNGGVVSLQHTTQISCIAISPDNNKIITASEDKMVRVFDQKSGQCILRCSMLEEPITCLALASVGKYSEEGKYILVGSFCGTVKIFNRVTGECRGVTKIEGHGSIVSLAAGSYFSEGFILIVGTADGCIWHADVYADIQYPSISRARSPIFMMKNNLKSFALRQDMLFACVASEIIIYSIENNKIIQKIPAKSASLLAVSRYGEELMVVDSNKNIEYYSGAPDSHISMTKKWRRPIVCEILPWMIAFAYADKVLIVLERFIKLWHVETQTLLVEQTQRLYTAIGRSNIVCFSLSEDSKILVVGFKDGTFKSINFTEQLQGLAEYEAKIKLPKSKH